MNQNPKELSLKLPIIATLVIATGITCLYFLMSYLNQQRKIQVTNQYLSELEPYVSKNQAGLETIFKQIMPNETCYQPPNSPNSCPTPQGEKIASLISSDLKDFSSTFFIKLGKNNKILFMYLSGEVIEVSPYPQENRYLLEKLLKGEEESPVWDEFFYQFPHKEVVIPVKDQSGQIMGAIVRGVIEQTN